MIFLYELQEACPQNTKDSYRILYPLTDANNIYRFLYKLELDSLELIKQIQLIHNSSFDEKYKNIFKEYSADINDYKSQKVIHEIIDRFPETEELQDHTKRIFIEKLIHETEFINFNNDDVLNEFKSLAISEEKDYIISLPYKKEITSKLIKSIKDSHLQLFSNCSSMRIKHPLEIKKLDSKLYKEVTEKLNKIKNDYSKHKIDPIINRNYHPPTFLENFKDNFFECLIKLISDDKKRVHFSGEDAYLTKRAINHLLASDTPLYYDLVKGIPVIDHNDTSVVFFNFDKVEDPVDYKKLYKRVENISKVFYIILQATRQKIVQYFLNYENVEIPKKDEIVNSITSIFLSLIIERRIYETEFNKLLGLVEKNALKSLLVGIKDIECLYNAIIKLEKLTVDDLLSNADFWCYLISELERTEEPLKIVQKTKITFEHSGSEWGIYGLGKVLPYNYSTNIGIKYLVVIIQYYLINQESIEVTRLRDLVIDFNNNKIEQDRRKERLQNKNLTNYDLQETDRKTILAALAEIKKEPKIKDFINNHIKYEKYQYWFDDKDKVECVIIDSNLKKELLTKN